MIILEYDEVDPLQVLHLTLLALDFPLTSDHATHLRSTDPRPFPFLTIHAVEDDQVVGQVGVFRLPMVSLEGREDVGGVWAVCTHPEYAGRGLASLLLDEAHMRMRDAGIRFSTLGTDRFRVGYKLYQRLGYVDTKVWATAMGSLELARRPTHLRCETPGTEGFDFVECIYSSTAADYLGFAWRHTPFTRLRDNVKLEDIYVISEQGKAIGYVFVKRASDLLKINIQVIRPGINIVDVVASVATESPRPYVQVTLSCPSHIASLRRAGWHVAHPSWDAFMIKPLLPDLTDHTASQLFGIGTDRFLISWLDVT